MDYYQYLLSNYGKESADVYLEILKQPLNINQFEEDESEIYRLIEIEENKKYRQKDILIIEWGGESLTLSEWSYLLNISPSGLYKRLQILGYCQETFTSCHTHKKITLEGKTQSITDWAKELNMTRKSFKKRLEKKNSSDILRKKRERATYTFKNETLTISEWANKLNLSYNAFYRRITRWGANNPKTYTTLRKNKEFKKNTNKKTK